MQMTSQQLTSQNYICVLSSYLILGGQPFFKIVLRTFLCGQLKDAGEIVDQWQRSKARCMQQAVRRSSESWFYRNRG
jgi:hypothetical protein